MSIYSDAKAIASDIMSLAKKAKNLDMQKKINELEERLIDGDRDVRSKDAQIEELEGALKFRETLTYRENAYWTSKGDGPFCSGCWDGQKKAIRIAKKGGIYECPICKHTYILNKTGTFPARRGLIGPSRGSDDEEER